MMSPDQPITFAKALNAKYGTSWLTWNAEVFGAVVRMMRGEPMTDTEAERAEAVREVLRSDRFTDDPLLFGNLAHALCGTPFDHTALEPCTPSEIAYALEWITVLAGEDKLGELSESVRVYIAACLAEGGVAYAAPEFRFDLAGEELDNVLDPKDGVVKHAKEAWDKLMDGGRPDEPVATFLSRLRAIATVRLREASEADKPAVRAAMTTLAGLAGVWLYLHRQANPA